MLNIVIILVDELWHTKFEVTLIKKTTTGNKGFVFVIRAKVYISIIKKHVLCILNTENNQVIVNVNVQCLGTSVC